MPVPPSAKPNALAADVARLENQFADLLAQHVALKSLVLDTDDRTEEYAQLLERARAVIAQARVDRDAQLIGMAVQSLPGAHDA